MSAINNEALKRKIESEGLKQTYIADQLGISYTSMLNKTSGRTEFTMSEVSKLQEVLHLDDEDFREIFLADV